MHFETGLWLRGRGIGIQLERGTSALTLSDYAAAQHLDDSGEPGNSMIGSVPLRVLASAILNG
jgi:hypothetical protein